MSDFSKALDNLILTRKGVSNPETPLTKGAESPTYAPAKIDVGRWLQHAPSYNIPTGATAKFIQDAGANYQGNLRRNLNAIPRAASTAIFEAMQFGAFFIDLVGNRFSEKDDQAMKWLSRQDEALRESLFPILHRTSYNEKSLLQQLGSSEFFGEELAQGVGFFAGMMIPGLALSKLGAFKAWSRGIRGANYQMVDKMRKNPAMRKLMEASKKGSSRSAWQISGETADKLSLHTYTALQTMIESGMEASFAQEELYESLSEKVKKREINPQTGKPWTRLDVEKSLKQAGSSLYWYNMMVLGVSNTIMNNMIFGSRKLKGRDFIKRFEPKVDANLNRWSKALKSVGKYSNYYGKNIVQGVVSEGFWEEGMQTAGEMILRAKKLKDEDPNTFELFGNIIDGYANMLGTKEGAKAIIIGGFLGSGAGVFQAAGEIKKSKDVYEQIQKHRKDIVEKWLQPLFGDIYERDENGKIKIENNQPVFKAAHIIASAEEKLKLHASQAALSEIALKNPQEFERIMRTVVIPNALLNYMRFDETTELLVDDLKEVYSKFINENPTSDQLMSVDEMLTLIQEMRQDVKDIDSIADMYGIVGHTQADLKSKDEATKFKPIQFAWEAITTNYVNLKNSERYIESKLEDPNTSDADKVKLKEDLKIVQKDLNSLKNLNKHGYAKAYLNWKNGVEVDAKKKDRAALRTILESVTGLSKKSQDLFIDNYFADIENNGAFEREYTSTFSILDEDGNVIEEDLDLVLPTPNANTAGSNKQNLKLSKDGSVYEIVEVANDDKLRLFKDGIEINNFELVVTKEAKEKAREARISVLEKMLKTFNDSLENYYNQIKGKNATYQVEDFEEITKEFIEDIKQKFENLTNKSYSELVDIFEDLQKMSKEQEAKNNEIRKAFDDFHLYVGGLGTIHKNPNILKEYEHALSQSKNEDGFLDNDELKIFVEMQFPDLSDAEKSDIVKELQQRNDKLKLLFKDRSEIKLEDGLKQLFEKIIRYVYYTINDNEVKANQINPDVKLNTLEEIKALFTAQSGLFEYEIFKLDAVDNLSSFPQMNFQQVKDSNDQIVDDLESRKPTLDLTGGSLIRNILRPAINDETNRKILAKLRAKGVLTEQEQRNLAYYENLDSFMQMLANGEMKPIAFNNNVHLISAQDMLSSDSKVRKQFGDNIWKHIYENVLFFIGEGNFATLKDIQEGKVPNAETALSAAMGDPKMVMLGINGAILPNPNRGDSEHLLVGANNLEDYETTVLHASILSRQNLGDSEENVKPSFLYTKVNGIVQERYRDMPKDAAERKAFVEEAIRVYNEIFEKVKDGPISMIFEGVTVGSWRFGKSYGWEQLDMLGENEGTLFTFLEGNNPALPVSKQDKTAFDLLNDGTIIHQGKLGQGNRKPGQLYLNLQGRQHPMLMSLLNDSDVNNIVELFKFIINNPQEVDVNNKIMHYISSLMHISPYNMVLANTPYALSISSEGIFGNISGFTVDYVTAGGQVKTIEINQDFFGSANEALFKDFLKTKRYNIQYKERIEKAGYSIFTAKDDGTVEVDSYGNYANYFNEMSKKVKLVLTRLNNSDRRYADNVNAQFTPEIEISESTEQVKPETKPETTLEEVSLPVRLESVTDEEVETIFNSILNEIDNELDKFDKSDIASIRVEGYVLQNGFPAQIDAASLRDFSLLDEESANEALKKYIGETFYKPTENQKPTDEKDDKPLNMVPSTEKWLGLDINNFETQEDPAVSQAAEWFAKHHPDAELKVTSGLIGGEAVGRLLDGGDILVSRLWSSDTIYHEAFHRVSMYFMSSQERKVQYDQVRARLNKPEMSDLEAEEYLADEFRKYMIHGKNYIFPPQAKKQKTLFESIVDFFLNLIRSLVGVSLDTPMTMEDLFFYAKTGVFENPTVKSHYGVFNMIAGMSPAKSREFVRNLGNTVAAYLWSEKVLINPTTSIIYATQNKTSVDLKSMLRDIFLSNTESQIIDANTLQILKSYFNLIKEYNVELLKATPNHKDKSNEFFQTESDSLTLRDIFDELKLYISNQGIQLSFDVNDQVIENDDDNVNDPLDENNDETTVTALEELPDTEFQGFSRENRNLIKGLPSIAKMFFFGVLHNPLSLNQKTDINIPAMEAHLNSVFKIFVEKMKGLSANDMLGVLQNLSKNNRAIFEPLVKRMEMLIKNSDFNPVFKTAFNQIYTATQQNTQEIISYNETDFDNNSGRAEYFANIREFVRFLQSSEFVISGTQNLIDLQKIIDEFRKARQKGVVNQIDFLEDIFGPIIRMSKTQDLNFFQKTTAKNLFDEFESVMIKIIEDKNLQVLYKNQESFEITVTEFSKMPPVKTLMKTLALVKSNNLPRPEDQTVEKLKGSRKKTKQQIISENTHLTNLINAINSAVTYTNTVKNGSIDSAVKYLEDVLVSHNLVRRIEDEKGRSSIEPYEHIKNNFIVQEIMRYYNDVKDRKTVEFSITEYLLDGFKSEEDYSDSKAFETMNEFEVFESYVRSLVHGAMPMVPQGARTRESLIAVHKDGNNRLGEIYDSQLGSSEGLTFFEKSLADSFFDEIYRMVDFLRTKKKFKENAPGSILKFLSENNYQSAYFDDLYSAYPDLKDSVKTLVDDLSKLGFSDPNVRKKIEDFRSIHREKVIGYFENLAKGNARNLLNSFSQNSQNSRHDTDITNYLKNNEVPKWVGIISLADLFLDSKETFQIEQFDSKTSKIITVAYDFKQLIESDLKDAKKYYVINPAMFGISEKNSYDGRMRSSFIDRVAQKYKWTQPIKEDTEIFVEIKDIPGKDVKNGNDHTGFVLDNAHYIITEQQALDIAKELALISRFALTTTQTFAIGSPAMFGNIKNYLRRQESVGSSKNVANFNSTIDRMDGKIVNNTQEIQIKVNTDITKMYNSQDSLKVLARLKKLVDKESDPKIKKTLLDEIKEIQKNIVGGFEGTDAYSRIPLDYYKQLLVQNGIWPEDFEKMYVYQYQLFFQKAIDYNKTVTDDKKLRFEGNIVDDTIWTINPVLNPHGKPTMVNGILVPTYNKQPVDIESNFVFKTQKPQATGSKKQEATALPYFVQLKTAFTPIMFSEHIQDTDRFLELWDMTIVNKIDVDTFGSAVKNMLQEGVIHDFSVANYGLQFNEPLTSKSQAVLSSQKSALFGIDLYENNLFSEQEKIDFFENEEKFNDLMSSLVSANELDYFAKLGLKLNQTTKELTVANKKLFNQQMLKMSSNGTMDAGTLKQLSEFITNSDKTLDEVVGSRQFLNVFLSGVSKYVNTIRHQSIKSIIQEPDIYGELKFYRIENDKIRLPEIKMPIPDYYRGWILKTFGDPLISKEANFVYAYTKFKEAYKNNDPRIPAEMRETIINRTPMDNRHSATAVEIKEYLLPWEGNKVVLPMELVYIYGFDFDFDKVTTYSKTPTFNKNGTIKYNGVKTSVDEVVSDILNDIQKQNVDSLNRLLSLTEGLSEFKDIQKEIKKTYNQILTDPKNMLEIGRKKIPTKISDAIKNQKITAKGLKEILVKLNNELILAKFTQSNQEVISTIEKSIEKNTELLAISLNNIEKLNNRNIEIAGYDLNVLLKNYLEKMIQMPEFGSKENQALKIISGREAILNDLLDVELKNMKTEPAILLSLFPVGVEKLSSLTQKYSKADKAISKWSDVYDLSKVAKLRSVMLNTGQGIGIGASAISLFSRLQKSPLELQDDFQIPIEGFMDKKAIVGQTYDVKGQITSLWNSQFINLFLDVTKNPDPFMSGINSFITGPITFMMILGGRDGLTNKNTGNIDPETIIRILNTPIVNLFTKYYYMNVVNNKFQTRYDALKDAFARAAAELKIHISNAYQLTESAYIENYDSKVIAIGNSEQLKVHERNLYPQADSKSNRLPFLFQSTRRLLGYNQKNIHIAKVAQNTAKLKSFISNEKLDVANGDAKNDAWAVANVEIMDAFLTMLVYSENSTKFMIPLRRDGNMPDSLSKIESYENTRDEYLNQKTPKIFTQSSLRKFVEGNYLKDFMEVDNYTFDFLSSRYMFYKFFTPEERKDFFNNFNTEITYEMIQEYWPSFLVSMLPGIKEKAEELFFGSAKDVNSLSSSFLNFQEELRKVVQKEIPGYDISNHVLIKAFHIETSLEDKTTLQSIPINTVKLTNERIQGTDLQHLREWIESVTKSEQPELRKTARIFFDNLVVMSFFQNAHNRMYNVSKTLVGYDTYIDTLSQAVSNFLANSDKVNRAKMLDNFAKSLIVTNAKKSNYSPTRYTLDEFKSNVRFVNEEEQYSFTMYEEMDGLFLNTDSIQVQEIDMGRDFLIKKRVAIEDTIEILPNRYYVDLFRGKAFELKPQKKKVTFIFERTKAEDYSNQNRIYNYRLIDIEGFGSDLYNPFNDRKSRFSKSKMLLKAANDALRYEYAKNEGYSRRPIDINKESYIEKVQELRQDTGRLITVGGINFLKEAPKPTEKAKRDLMLRSVLSTMLGQKIAENIMKTATNNLIEALELAFDNYNQKAEIFDSQQSEMLLKELINPMSKGTYTLVQFESIWDTIKDNFNHKDNVYTKKAFAIFNSYKNADVKELRKNNATELSKVSFDPSTVKPEDSKLFALSDTQNVVDLFYNFDQIFPDNDWMTKYQKVAMIRMINSEDVKILCSI